MGLLVTADITPGLVIKASAPFWFDKVSYNVRMIFAILLMLSSFLLVASSSKLELQLLGVGCASAQSAIGESSILALTSRSRTALLPSCLNGLRTARGTAGA
jgi:battenin